MSIATIADIEKIEAIPLAARGLPASTYAVIRQTAGHSPDAPALRFFLKASSFAKTHDWTYREFFADVTRTANAFHQLGVGPRNVVAFLLPNLPETHFTVWGGEAAGIVMAINPLLEASVIGDLMRTAKVKVVVTMAPTADSDLWPKVASQLGSLPSVTDVVWVSMAAYVTDAEAAAFKGMAAQERRAHGDFSIHDFRDLIRSQPSSDLISQREILGADISSYFCTGGTTGLPKIAMRTHGCEVFNAWAMMMVHENRPNHVYFCGLPLFHVNGQVVTGLLPWMRGASVVLGTPPGYRSPGLFDHFWEIVEHFRISYFSGVPTIFAALLSRPIGKNDISSLVDGLCGGAPMPVELFRDFERASELAILEGYGLTEGACASSTNPISGERRVGSIGLRLPYQKMQAARLDENGRYLGPAPIDEVGAILIHGPNVFAGYLDEMHNRTAWVEINGERWLNTGDLGRQDAEHYFWLTGRKKELIIRGGHNLDPKQIEEAIQAHPMVSLVAAIGSPDPYLGEVPVAYVQLVPGGHADPATLLEFAKRSISERSAIPKRIEIVDALPLTAVGKIAKPALQMLEVARVIRSEAAEAGIEDIAVDVVQDRRRGLVARIRDSGGRAKVAAALGRYTFNIEWI